jgi:predicted dehydrogenase
MLSAAIILPVEAEMLHFDSLRSIEGVEWDGIFYSGTKKNYIFDRALIISSPEIIPLICDLLIVIDPNFCTFDYLSFAIRNGCHLFLSDKLTLTTTERKQLIHLASEGKTYIQIQNDFLFHPFQEKIRSQTSRTCFIEASQSVPAKPDRLNDLLLNNLLMILRAAGSPVHKINIFCGTIPSRQPDILNIYINFKNGSVATLTLKFIDHQVAHFLSVHAAGKFTTFDFSQNKISHYPEEGTYKTVSIKSPDPLQEQIADFIKNITEKNNPGFSLDDEIQVFLLMEKIKEKIEIHSFTTY